jgi:hypothetical protein
MPPQDITLEPSALDIAQLVSYFITSSAQSLTARRLAYQLDTLKKTVASQSKQIETLIREKNTEYYRGVNDTEEIWDEKLTELKTAHELVVAELTNKINELNTIISGHSVDQLISQFESDEAAALRGLMEQQNKQLADQVDLLIITKEII